MLNLLKDLSQKADNTYVELKDQNKQRYFVYLILLIFVVFLGIGFAGGALFSSPPTPEQNSTEDNEQEETFYEGRIAYVDPQLYPGEDVSYVLLDKSGDLILLLKSRDQKLVVVEGQWAKVYGTLAESASGDYEVLNVSEIVLRQSN